VAASRGHGRPSASASSTSSSTRSPASSTSPASVNPHFSSTRTEAVFSSATVA